MRTIFPVVASLALAGVATPAIAQDSGTASGDEVAALTDRMADPAFQQELATTIATLSQVLLDVPIAPLAEAAADMAGEAAGDIDPDLTIRKAAPDAARVPEAIERELPRVMDQMAGMSGAIAAMLPALREAARQMEGAFEGIEIH